LLKEKVMSGVTVNPTQLVNRPKKAVALQGKEVRAKALGAHQHSFLQPFQILVFEQKFRPKYALKCGLFGKSIKIAAACSAPKPPPCCPVYYCNFTGFVLALNAFFFTTEKRTT